MRVARVPLACAMLVLAAACSNDPGAVTQPPSSSPTTETTTTTVAPSTVPATTTTETTTTTAPTTTQPTTTTTTTTPVDLDTLTWARVPHDEALFGGPGLQCMFSVAAGGPGLVAVGMDASGGEADAAVWVSADGYAWSRIPHDEALFGGPGDQEMRGVTAGGPGLVAVGMDASGGFADGAVWVSADGYAWTRIAGDAGTFGGPGNQILHAVVAGGPGLVAGGVSEAHDDGGDAAIWLSADGYNWSQVPHDVAIFGAGGGQGISAIAVGGPGLVAVGYAVPHLSPGPPIWLSADGYTWTRVSHDQTPYDEQSDFDLTAVVAGGPGLVAAGYEQRAGYLDAVVLVSAAGAVWTRFGVEGESFGGLGNQEITSLVATGTGLVAAGYNWGAGERDAPVWVSADGYAWALVADPQDFFGGPDIQEIFSLAIGGPGLVAVGYDAAGDNDWSAAVWVAAPSQP